MFPLLKPERVEILGGVEAEAFLVLVLDSEGVSTTPKGAVEAEVFLVLVIDSEGASTGLITFGEDTLGASGFALAGLPRRRGDGGGPEAGVGFESSASTSI